MKGIHPIDRAVFEANLNTISTGLRAPGSEPKEKEAILIVLTLRKKRVYWERKKRTLSHKHTWRRMVQMITAWFIRLFVWANLKLPFNSRRIHPGGIYTYTLDFTDS